MLVSCSHILASLSPTQQNDVSNIVLATKCKNKSAKIKPIKTDQNI